MKKCKVEIGDKFIATTIDQTIEILDIFTKQKKGKKPRAVLRVEIIRNQFAGEHTVYADLFVDRLFDSRCYESFN